jgi:hypothetical protein
MRAMMRVQELGKCSPFVFWPNMMDRYAQK